MVPTIQESASTANALTSALRASPNDSSLPDAWIPLAKSLLRRSGMVYGNADR